MNTRNLQHGMSETPTYWAWQSLKRSKGGICLSWRKFATFMADMGSRPSSRHWLFKSRSYQRSNRGNVKWRTYKRSFRDIWQYLTSEEVLACQQHIKIMCERGGYDFDAGMNEFYLQNLERAKDPVARIHSWIKRFLPRILSQLKKRRNEVRYIDEVCHEL